MPFPGPDSLALGDALSLINPRASARLNTATRVSDLAVRMGGDEFLVLLPECPAEQVENLLSRLTPLEVHFQGQKIPVTFSARWVSYERGETPEQFLERADRTLYADKRAGKARRSQVPVVG